GHAPTIGRFISERPAGLARRRSGNLYRYVSNNPLIYTDPTGWCKQNAQPVIQGPSGNSGGSGGWLGMFGNELANTYQSGINNAASGIGYFGSAALNWGFDTTGNIFNALLGGSVAHAPTLDITPERMYAYESST
ncbi:MAG: hypothetical protein HC898_13025, partial [Phycisphaerales bacterium]|nr:hypothetical protein [Phycisphaerales bacterium]